MPAADEDFVAYRNANNGEVSVGYGPRPDLEARSNWSRVSLEDAPAQRLAELRARYVLWRPQADVEGVPPRQWYDWHGGIVEAPAAAPATSYDRVGRRTHRLMGDGWGSLRQAVTRCGQRGCGEIPGRGPVDCPECMGVRCPDWASPGGWANGHVRWYVVDGVAAECDQEGPITRGHCPLAGQHHGQPHWWRMEGHPDAPVWCHAGTYTRWRYTATPLIHIRQES